MVKKQQESEELTGIVDKVLRRSVRKIVTELQSADYRKLSMIDEIDLQFKATQETAKEILDEVSKHCGGDWLVELYQKYGVEATK